MSNITTDAPATWYAVIYGPTSGAVGVDLTNCPNIQRAAEEMWNEGATAVDVFASPDDYALRKPPVLRVCQKGCAHLVPTGAAA